MTEQKTIEMKPTDIETIKKEFEEKYQSFELSKVVDKLSFDRHKDFLQKALEKAYQKGKEDGIKHYEKLFKFLDDSYYPRTKPQMLSFVADAKFLSRSLQYLQKGSKDE